MFVLILFELENTTLHKTNVRIILEVGVIQNCGIPNDHWVNHPVSKAIRTIFDYFGGYPQWHGPGFRLISLPSSILGYSMIQNLAEFHKYQISSNALSDTSVPVFKKYLDLWHASISFSSMISSEESYGRTVGCSQLYSKNFKQNNLKKSCHK